MKYIKTKDGRIAEVKENIGSWYLYKIVDIPVKDRSDYDIYGMILCENEKGTPMLKHTARWGDKGGWEPL